jgi:hypothetical protein
MSSRNAYLDPEVCEVFHVESPTKAKRGDDPASRMAGPR